MHALLPTLLQRDDLDTFMETGAAPLNGHHGHDGERAYIASCGMVGCWGRAGTGDLQGGLRKEAANVRG